jgi:hypothetical protein
MDPLLFAVLQEIILWQQWVCLNLVHRWRFSRRLDDRLEMLDREIAHTDSFDFAGTTQSEHRLPRVYERGLRVDFNFIGIASALWECPATWDERDGPVHEI